MPYQEGCIFCDIARGKSPANIEYRDDRVVAFWDIDPKAPVHILVVPKDHLESLRKAAADHTSLLGHLMLVAKAMAEKKNLAEDGYRLVLNTGRHSGQIVEHLHLHLLGGRQMGPMG
jgi:histidine triad (HIT) family protein